MSDKSFYYGSLDGMRALSIIAVLIFHTNSVWLEGGFLGVEVFFVISGFIITTLLLNEFKKMNGRVTKVQVNWSYEENDDDMLEVGKEMSRIVKFPFAYIETGVR